MLAVSNGSGDIMTTEAAIFSDAGRREKNIFLGVWDTICPIPCGILKQKPGRTAMTATCVQLDDVILILENIQNAV